VRIPWPNRDVDAALGLRSRALTPGPKRSREVAASDGDDVAVDGERRCNETEKTVTAKSSTD
jgi:hypothetical protein